MVHATVLMRSMAAHFGREVELALWSSAARRQKRRRQEGFVVPSSKVKDLVPRRERDGDRAPRQDGRTTQVWNNNY